MNQRTLFAISLFFILSGDISADDLSRKALVTTLCQQRKFTRALSIISACPDLLRLFGDGEKNPLYYGAIFGNDRFVGEVYDKDSKLALLKNDQGKTPYQAACSVQSQTVELFEQFVHEEHGDRRILNRRQTPIRPECTKHIPRK